MNRSRMMYTTVLPLILVVAAMAAPAGAATLLYGRGQSGDYGVDKIDMVGIEFGQWNHRVAGANPDGTGADAYIQMCDYDTTATVGWLPLIGFANLVSGLNAAAPAGEVVVIDIATLELIADTYDVGALLTVNRITTDWLVNTAGQNQNNVRRPCRRCR